MLTGGSVDESPLARLRIGFAGTPPFAAAALVAIRAAGGSVELVLTQPDRPSGRGMTVVPSAVKAYAVEQGLRILQPPNLKGDAVLTPLLGVALDVLVVAAYGLILPPAILAWPRHGCLNIHASLLPRWRGAAPIQRAILAGDPTTGITIMQMDAGLDTGPTIEASTVPIGSRDTAGSLTTRLAEVGAAAIVRVLARFATDGVLVATAQPADGATYAGKIGRADAELDWRRDAIDLDRAIRAFDPAPGATTALAGDPVKLWSALPLPGTPDIAPGTVMAVGPAGVDVACGTGVLRLVTVQPAGGKRMTAAAFAAGRALAPGSHFGTRG
ncbi:MAG: methionyl-tRNA formyltransferase [Burkholderiales bacterium]|nr:methionyl-tRNA formyltransferase [Burkholderiales bacterium]